MTNPHSLPATESILDDFSNLPYRTRNSKQYPCNPSFFRFLYINKANNHAGEKNSGRECARGFLPSPMAFHSRAKGLDARGAEIFVGPCVAGKAAEAILKLGRPSSRRGSVAGREPDAASAAAAGVRAGAIRPGRRRASALRHGRHAPYPGSVIPFRPRPGADSSPSAPAHGTRPRRAPPARPPDASAPSRSGRAGEAS